MMAYTDSLLEDEDLVPGRSAESDEGEDKEQEELIRITRPVFEDPMALINLEADIDKFLAAPKINDVWLPLSSSLSHALSHVSLGSSNHHQGLPTAAL